jgi:hypothetical protein
VRPRDPDFGIYYDRDGKPITLERWAELRHQDQDYQRIAEDTVGDYWVSTVWLGINHQFGNGPPLIFETMVFAEDGRALEGECWRYSTEQQAAAGHREVVTMVRHELELTGEER